MDYRLPKLHYMTMSVSRRRVVVLPRRRPAALTRTRFAAKTGGEIMALAVDTAAGLLYRVA